MHELYEEKVTLEPISHTYRDTSGRIYESLSRVRGCIKEDFKSDYLSKLTAQKRGISQEEVLGEWKATAKVATDHGTKVHLALENYANTAKIEAEHEHLRPMVLAVNALYKDYHAVYQEKTLYDEEYGIAGTADTICVTTRSKNSILDISDFKTGGKGIYYESKYKKYLLGEFSHIQDTNYYDYSLQLSCYAMMLSNLTGRKIGKLSIIYIPPENPLAFRIIPVPFLLNDARLLFNTYRSLRSVKVEKISQEKQVTMPYYHSLLIIWLFFQ